MKKLWLAILFVLALSTGSPDAVQAQETTFTVNSIADDVDATPGDGICDDGAGNCTVRAAIQEANTLAGADTIDLPAGTYTLDISGTNEDNSTTGDLDIKSDLTINGAGSSTTTIDGGGIDRVLQIHTGTVVEINGVTLTNGGAVAFAGGIFISGALTLTSSRVISNTADRHGGITISVSSTGASTINDSIISANAASVGRGGGIGNGGTLTISGSTIGANTANGAGGGLVNEPGGDLTINGTTVIDNSAALTGGGFFLRSGGTAAISTTTISGNTASDTGGGAINGGALTLTNTTVSGNNAGNRAGGIANIGGIGDSPSVTLTNSTISGNSASEGGGVMNQGGSIVLVNTIIAKNTPGGDCLLFSNLTSLGHNLDGDNTCNLTDPDDLSGIDPSLGPLQKNGGPTLTHALLVGSPAIDAVPVVDCTVTTDQRGVFRPQGSACDIGAFEAEPAAEPTPTPIPSVSQWALVAMAALFAIVFLKRINLRHWLRPPCA